MIVEVYLVVFPLTSITVKDGKAISSGRREAPPSRCLEIEALSLYALTGQDVPVVSMHIIERTSRRSAWTERFSRHRGTE